MQQPWKVIAAFVGVFVAGAIFGAFFTLGTGSRTADTPPVQPTPVVAATTTTPSPTTAPSPTATPSTATPGTATTTTLRAEAPRAALLQVPQTWQAPQLVRRYAERLDLTPEQKERLHPLFQRAAEDYRRVQQNTFRDTGFILNRLQQDLAKELNPEQLAKLRKMEEAQREKLQKAEPTKFRDLRKTLGGQKQGARKEGPAAGTSAGSTSTASPSTATGATGEPSESEKGE